MSFNLHIMQDLWEACSRGNLIAVNESLDKGANFNWENPDEHVRKHVC